jgi:uncharacterized membrane protein
MAPSSRIAFRPTDSSSGPRTNEADHAVRRPPPRGQQSSREAPMSVRDAKPDRLSLFSDGVFAVAITFLAFGLKAPQSASFDALISLWPTAVSYAVSYLFIAIVWVNHHHLMRYADRATPRLIWANFLHLFTVSLMPFATAWIAGTALAPIPVAVYAGVFVVVNVTYLALCFEAIDRPDSQEVPRRARMMMRMRSLATLLVFVVAAMISLGGYPIVGMALICVCLIVYLRPEAPGGRHERSDAHAPSTLSTGHHQKNGD